MVSSDYNWVCLLIRVSIIFVDQNKYSGSGNKMEYTTRFPTLPSDLNWVADEEDQGAQSLTEQISSSTASTSNNNKKTYNLSQPAQQLTSNSSPVSFIALNRNNRPAFLVFGSSMSASSTVRPAASYINPNLSFSTPVDTQFNGNGQQINKQVATTERIETISTKLSPLDPSIISTANINNLTLTSTASENVDDSTFKINSLVPSTYQSTQSSTTSVSIIFKEVQVTSTSTTTNAPTTTSTARYEPPSPNVGIFNGLAKIAPASLGMGITSAAYAAAALWLPFIGRKKRSPKHYALLNQNERNNDWFINYKQ